MTGHFTVTITGYGSLKSDMDEHPFDAFMVRDEKFQHILTVSPTRCASVKVTFETTPEPVTTSEGERQ